MALDLNRVQDATRFVLHTEPDTRNNDALLVSKVSEILNPAIKGMKFSFVLEHRKELNLPSFESITRCRRKLQSTFASLRADKDVEEARNGLIEEYKDYSRKKVQ